MWTLLKCKGQLFVALSCRLYCRIVSKSNHSNNRAWHVICVWKQEPLQCTFTWCVGQYLHNELVFMFCRGQRGLTYQCSLQSNQIKSNLLKAEEPSWSLTLP